MSAIIEVQNLCHTYSVGTPFQHDAIQHLNFTVERGEFLGIIGHTGSGKSTLIQHLNGLLKPTQGEVLLAGENIHKDKLTTRAARFRVGLVFQYPEYQLFEETVYKDIAFGPKNMGLEGETRRLYAEGVFNGNGTATQAIGYKELLGYIRGEMTLDEAKEELKTASRRYAKRQMTWFSAHSNVNWIDVENGYSFDNVLKNASEMIGRFF